MNSPQANIKKAFLYAFGYVGIATIILYSGYPSDIFAFNGVLYENPVYSIMTLCCLPGNILGFVIRFTEKGMDGVVLCLQGVMLLIWWGIIYSVMKNKK